jgi:hypothetical protein
MCAALVCGTPLIANGYSCAMAATTIDVTACVQYLLLPLWHVHGMQATLITASIVGLQPMLLLLLDTVAV